MTISPFTTDKDPDSDEDYLIDYTTQLAESTPGDVIFESTWVTSTVPGNTDLTLDYRYNLLLPDGVSAFLLPDGVSELLLPSTDINAEGNTTSVWVRHGGKLGTKHRLVNRVKTVGGRTWDKTIIVTMKNK